MVNTAPNGLGLQGVDPPGEGQLQKEEEEPATAEPWHLAVAFLYIMLIGFDLSIKMVF